MASQLQLRRGTTVQHGPFIGAPAEVTVDTDKKTLVVHDGTTPGGFPVLSASGGTMTGPVSMGGSKITSLATPTAPTDATPKGYVDGLIAAATLADADYGDITVSGAATVWTIDNNAVTAAKIASGAVTDAKIASGVDASKLTTGTLPADRIGSDAITTARINNAAVTAAKLDGAQTGSAPIYGCRAWVSFVGTTGSTVDGEFRCTINGSGNVTKVVRNSTGVFTVHLTTAMPTANYAVTMSYQIASGANTGRATATTTNQITLAFSDNIGAQNPTLCGVAIFG